MSFIKDLLRKIFEVDEDHIVLDARIEFRLNKKEKILIQKYCELKKTDCSKLFRTLAMKEIDTFLNNVEVKYDL